jgi:hypothetical protein
MAKFFSPNINGAGRILRAVFGVALIITGLLLSQSSHWICTALVLTGGFVLFEAARGWCFLRACGIKTKL